MSNFTTPTLLLMAREAAESLRISGKTLWNLTAPRGPIPVVRLGKRSVRYDPIALRAYLDQQQSANENGER